MTNREWIDLLSKEFAVSRTSARDMLHALMTISGMTISRGRLILCRNRIGRMEMNRLDKAIADVAYILDTLMAYRNIVKSGCCNDCRIAKPYSCEHLPKPGQLVRYNCPFYERKKVADE